MFDGILKPKLYTKSKSHVKMTRTRLEAVRKKKSSILKYLKNDVADLLRNGLDYNAYGRAEGLLVERNMLSCYELINSFCETISNNLSLIYKQRECPEGCKEAVASLIYAAARFADLPELRDLRTLFSERYGNSLEAFMNKEFAEQLNTMPPSKEEKLQLLQEIAIEFSIEWNSKALEQRLYAPPPLEKPTSNFNDDGYKLDMIKGPVASEKERKNPLDGRKEVNDDDSLLGSSDNTDEDVKKGISEEAEAETDNQKPFYYRFIPPPYLKPRSLEEPIKEKPHFDKEESNNLHENAKKQQPKSAEDSEKPKPRSVRRRNLKPPPGRENLDRIRSSESRLQGKEERTGKKSDEEDKEEAYLRQPRMHRNGKSEVGDSVPPTRAVSLPAESTSPTETIRRHVRASSLQPEMRGHVHPKLPDYEELAARFAALKGK